MAKELLLTGVVPAPGRRHTSIAVRWKNNEIDGGQARIEPPTRGFSVDINTIRGWLGHASINTTNLYAEVDLEAKSKALAACSPGKMGGSRSPWKSAAGVMEFLRAL
jgi:integrase